MLKPRQLRVFDALDPGGEQRQPRAPAAPEPWAQCGRRAKRRRQTNGVANSKAAASHGGERAARPCARVGQVEPADVEQEAAGQHDALARRRQALQDGDIPEDDLDQLRGVANELHEDERDVAKEPVHRQPHDADQQAEQRRRDDAHGGDQQRIQQADQQRARVGVVDRPGNEMERNVETGARAEKAEAERQIAGARDCRRASMPETRRAPRRPAGRPTGRSRPGATGDGSPKRSPPGQRVLQPAVVVELVPAARQSERLGAESKRRSSRRNCRPP